MLQYLPRQTPSLAMMIEDIGAPKSAVIARSLGVSARSVERWSAAEAAPRPVMLALYWITRWGRSDVDCRAANDATTMANVVRLLESENRSLRAALAAVVALREHGSANDPVTVDFEPLRTRRFDRRSSS